MTTVRDWINEDARRRAPEFDFGTQWTREHDPNTEWALTYNCGTGELYARTRSGDDVDVLARFADPQDVTDTIPDWGRRSMQNGSLDWVTRHLRSTPAPEHNTGPDAVYAVALNTDGTAVSLHEPPTVDDVRARLGDTLDVVTIRRSRDPAERIVMWVDDIGHHKQLPVNVAATQLYGTGWPILGDAVIANDDQRPLPDELVRQLVPDLDDADPAFDTNRDYDADVAVTALDWDDRLDDLERSDHDLGLDDIDDFDEELEMVDTGFVPEAAQGETWDIEHGPQAGSEQAIDDELDLER